MKANELMIGDWVYVSKNFIQKYHKIRALSNDEGAVLKGIYVNEYGIESNSAFSPNDTNPIPLTPEILEKNGFKLDKEDGWWWLTPKIGITFWEEGDIELEFENKHSSVDIHINYLHQLQHTLRLCGIEKEIEL